MPQILPSVGKSDHDCVLVTPTWLTPTRLVKHDKLLQGSWVISEGPVCRCLTKG